MEKSIHTREHAAFTATLRAIRKNAGVSQVQLAETVGFSQSFVSRLERGDCRLDVVQLRTICIALGTTLPAFIAAFEKRLTKGNR